MQVNSINLYKIQTFTSRKKKENDSKDKLGKLIKEMNSSSDSILKISGTYPNIKPSLITLEQYEREKNLRRVLSDSKNVEHDINCVNNRSLAILRFIENGFSNWNHKKALKEMRESNKTISKINGKYYTLTDNKDETLTVTRLYDSAKVKFNQSEKVLEIRQNDYLIRTECCYFKEGEEKPFLYCDGIKETSKETSVQRLYYIGRNNRLYKNFKIKNGKKYFCELFDFEENKKGKVLKEYRNSDLKISLLNSKNTYRYEDLTDGSVFNINM